MLAYPILTLILGEELDWRGGGSLGAQKSSSFVYLSIGLALLFYMSFLIRVFLLGIVKFAYYKQESLRRAYSGKPRMVIISSIEVS